MSGYGEPEDAADGEVRLLLLSFGRWELPVGIFSITSGEGL